MKLLTYNEKAHRPTCKRVIDKGVLTPIAEAIKLTPASCCHPERLEAWKLALEAPRLTVPAKVALPEKVAAANNTGSRSTTAVLDRPTEPALEAVSEVETKVKYPDALPKHAFRALAKIGGGMIAGELGVPYRSRGVEFCVFLGGKNIANLDTYLPTLWVAANNAVIEWRKTSPEYLAFDLSNKEEAKEAWEVEQQFLIDFCAANTVHPHRKSTSGFRAGAAWRVL